MGVSYNVVCNYDGRKMLAIIKGFDKVLLYAPCTGLSIISRDPSIKMNRHIIDIYKASHL